MGFMGSYADEITISRDEYEALKKEIEELKAQVLSLENQLEHERTWE